MTKISPEFLKLAQQAVFNKSVWQPTGPSYTLDEYLNAVAPALVGKAIKAEVVEQEVNGEIIKKIMVSFLDGTTFELRCRQADYEEGDVIDPKSIKGQMLTKVGSNPIVRFSGTVVK